MGYRNRVSMVLAFAFLVGSSLEAKAEIGVVPDVAPSPKGNSLTPEKVALGRILFFDPRLSQNGKISCRSCHEVSASFDHGGNGVDGLEVAKGIFGLRGPRNTPTVLNAGLRQHLFWDGRASSLEEQAKGPLVNPIEMGMPNLNAVERVVNSISGYKRLFEKAFSLRVSREKITIKEITDAIATYERTLTTPNSKFDQFQRGDQNALTAQEQKGWERFQKIGCVACHGAPTFTGKDYFVRFPLRENRELDFALGLTVDLGRYRITKNPAEMNRWRVPSLRNVEVTGPYFHNGAVANLEEAVRIMGRVQLGVVLEDEDVRSLVLFLNTLTGKLPTEAAPALPK